MRGSSSRERLRPRDSPGKADKRSPNPKVAIFFLAFLPQFVVVSAGPVWLQILVHGVLVIAIAGLIEPPLVLLADHVTVKLRASRRLARWLDRALGATLIALGVGLAATRR